MASLDARQIERLVDRARRKLTEVLREQMAQACKLDAAIEANLGEPGYAG
ncbi:MAG: hypothetical protein ACR2PL_25815 [Dehalococcoidia bacterium]